LAERADAARNRNAVLSAAGTLFDDAADPRAVSMDDVARAAGVGKGTIFRRFGNRYSLLHAVYEARLEELRLAVEIDTKLGRHGADLVEQIATFMDALVRFKLDNQRLVMALEDGGGAEASSLYDAPHYDDIHQRLMGLLQQTPGERDASWTAHALLAATRTDLINHLVTTENLSRRRLRANLRSFVERVVA
jgi:AcrR family transcriptional regulator